MDQKSRDNDTRTEYVQCVERTIWEAGSRISARIPNEAVAFYAAMLVITRGLRTMGVAEVLWITGDMHHRDSYPPPFPTDYSSTNALLTTRAHAHTHAPMLLRVNEGKGCTDAQVICTTTPEYSCHRTPEYICRRADQASSGAFHTTAHLQAHSHNHIRVYNGRATTTRLQTGSADAGMSLSVDQVA